MKTIKIKRELSSKRRGHIVFILIAAFWILLGLSSCTIERRLYRPGLHIELLKSKGKKEKIEVDNFISTTKAPLTSQFILPVEQRQVFDSASSGCTSNTKISYKPVLKNKKQYPSPTANTLLNKKAGPKSTPTNESDSSHKEEQGQKTKRVLFNSLLVAGTFLLRFTSLSALAIIPAIILIVRLLKYARKQENSDIPKKSVKNAGGPGKSEDSSSAVPPSPDAPEVHWAALASIFCAILFGPLGIYFAAKALKAIKRYPEKYTGEGLAGVGMAFSILTTILLVFFIILIVAIVASGGLSFSW